MRVCVVCRNYGEDRVLPRFSRYLRDRLGWELRESADWSADVVYLMGYFEVQKAPGWDVPPDRTELWSYFTHREEEPPGNDKARLWDQVAERMNLRVAMCRLYGDSLEQYGPVAIPPLPLEVERFAIDHAKTRRREAKPVVGLSGYTYSNARKGEDLVRGLLSSKVAADVEWRASGRGWPATLATKKYPWEQMPEFFQGLDVLVCPSRVEGGPMPVLEALACGVRVVAPAGVGIIDELPEAPGFWKYERGDLDSLVAALEQAVDLGGRDDAEREGLRACVSGHSVDGFVEAHAEMAKRVTVTRKSHKGVLRPEEKPVEVVVREPEEKGTGSKRGIYCVAFGDFARECCARMMASAKKHMPDIPICLGAVTPLGIEDLFVEIPDSDVGARRAKLMVYESTPAEWESVLYLDADTEVVAPIYQYFEWVEDGWDLAICQDIQSCETLHVFERKACKDEVAETMRVVGTPHTQQYNGGAWSFRRNERTAKFFARWRAEWERWAQRDQGALLRALHMEPIKVWVLGNEWNTFPKFQPAQETAGLLHFPGEARRWEGAIPGRIDGDEAWDMVRVYEARKRANNGHGRRR